VIHPLGDGLMQPALRAAPPGVIDDPRSGLNARDKEKHELLSCNFFSDSLQNQIGFYMKRQRSQPYDHRYSYAYIPTRHP
jgi:hypothetical protein